MKEWRQGKIPDQQGGSSGRRRYPHRLRQGKNRRGTASATSGEFFPRSSFPTFISSRRPLRWPICCARRGKVSWFTWSSGRVSAAAGEYVFSAYGYFFENEEITRPVHFLFETTMRSYFLHILGFPRELRFFHTASISARRICSCRGGAMAKRIFLFET